MDDKKGKYNKIKRCDKNKSKKLIPHNSNFNNLKSNKYFTNNTEENSMKKALTKYREKNINNNNNSSKIQSNISTTYCSNIYPVKPKMHKNLSFKVDKNILIYAEPRTKIKEFYKIQPKINDSIIDNENIDSFFDNDNNNNDDNIEINIVKKNTNKINTMNNIKHNIQNNNNNNNKNIKNKNYKKENILIDLNKINDKDINDNNNETIINEDNDIIDEESINKLVELVNNNPLNNTKKHIKEKKENKIIKEEINNQKEYFFTEIGTDKDNISNILNINETNLEYLITLEKLYNELIIDLEINKMEIYHNKISIIKDFLYVYNSQSIHDLYYIIDKMILNDNNLDLGKTNYTKSRSCTFNINFNANFLKTSNDSNNNNNTFLIIKEYLIMQIVFFYAIILIGLIKKEKKNYQSGLHNLAFYFHQNIIVFIYIIFSNLKLNSYDNYNEENNYEKCLKILNENKTWLDKNNYKRYMQTNNKLSRQIIINLLNQIKLYFKNNPYIDNNKPNNFIEISANLFLTYLNSFKKRKIINILTEIQNSSSINDLLESINFNKIISHYGEENNDSKKIEENESDYRFNTLNGNIPKPPFLEPISPKYKYTLVLDLDETLVHYISDNESSYIQIRPGAEEFIKELSEYYEIIIFTAALQTYADLVLEGIDPDGVISHRLYRQHTVSVGGANIKNLDNIGRDIKHVIIIDNSMENFALQPKNGLNIIDFEGNEYDEELDYLKEDLINLAKSNPDDVRYYLKDIQLKMDKRAIQYQKFNTYKEELNNGNTFTYNEDKYNLFSEIINKDNINNDNVNSEDKEKNVNYYIEGSENIIEEKS
jgi:Dullard-like phosphatase family protein